MSFLTLLLALLLEQIRPLNAHKLPHQLAQSWIAHNLRSFDAGTRGSAWLAWGLAVLLPSLVLVCSHHALRWWGGWGAWLLLFALHVAVLYFTLGFRQFSTHFNRIRTALTEEKMAQVQADLADWEGVPRSVLPADSSALIRRILGQASHSSHIHVFGPMLAYSLGLLIGLGPAGALLYRLAERAARLCRSSDTLSPSLRQLSLSLWRWLDWLPTRFSALLFAIVGNFEEAIAQWRQFSAQRASSPAAESPLADDADLLIRAAAGALGLHMHLGRDPSAYSTGAGGLQEPQARHLDTLVGLVWRAVVVWMTVLAFMNIANWV